MNVRKPQYLSPSALSTWKRDPEDYYCRYLADNPPPRDPQTQPMSVGSSFDAYVKSYLHQALFGTSDPQFEFTTLFETQVEEHCRDWALAAGEYCFTCYDESGALSALLGELEDASKDPQFESTLKGEIGGVPLLGKPDVWYHNRDGVPIILDWKVNGFCGDRRTYPRRGYVQVRGPGPEIHPAHHKADLSSYRGVTINKAEYFEAIEPSWSAQTATYAWLCGAEVGDEFIVAIDQLACNPVQPKDWPKIQIAEHRCLVGEEFQETLAQRYKELWQVIESGHIFKDRSEDESRRRCEVLDMQHAAYSVPEGEEFLEGLIG